MRRFTWKSCLGVIGIGLAVLFVAAVLYPVIVSEPPTSHRRSCLNNLKIIGMALNMYQTDWDGFMPIVPAGQRAPENEAWPGKVVPYMRDAGVLRCTRGPDDRLTYSFNPQLSGIKSKDIVGPVEVAMVFDSVSDSPMNNNLNGDSVWMPEDGGLPPVGSFVGIVGEGREFPKWVTLNHEDSNNVCYADGHARNFALIPGRRPEIRFSPHGR